MPMQIELVGALADPGVISDDSAARDRRSSRRSSSRSSTRSWAVPRTMDSRELRRAARRSRRRAAVLRKLAVERDERSRTQAGARALNLRTTRRMAAGLGARTVEQNQEALMAAAWDQLGAVREVSDELNRGRLSAEIGAHLAGRASRRSRAATA